MSVKIGDKVFGSWYVDEEIGSGAFGTVYKIKREDFGNVYYSALKVINIPPQNTDKDVLKSEGMDENSISTYYSDIAKTFMNEIKLLEQLKGYTNIVSYEDHLVEQNGVGYCILIRMELLTPLRTKLINNPLNEKEIIKLGIDICRALEICEKKKIIHRDIKPDNIFVSDNGDYELGDFGVARTMEKTVSQMSQKGTYTYMAPEVFLGREYDSTADLYSLGILLYQLLNKNRTPFLPSAPNPIMYSDRENAQKSRMSGKPVPEIQGVSYEWNKLLQKLLDYTPTNRFQSAAELKNALVALASGVKESLIQEDIKFNAEAQPTEKLFNNAEQSVEDDVTASPFNTVPQPIENTVPNVEQEVEDDVTVSPFNTVPQPIENTVQDVEQEVEDDVTASPFNTVPQPIENTVPDVEQEVEDDVTASPFNAMPQQTENTVPDVDQEPEEDIGDGETVSPFGAIQNPVKAYEPEAEEKTSVASVASENKSKTSDKSAFMKILEKGKTIVVALLGFVSAIFQKKPKEKAKSKSQAPSEKKSSKGKKIVLAVLGIVLIIAVVVGVFIRSNYNGDPYGGDDFASNSDSNNEDSAWADNTDPDNINDIEDTEDTEDDTEDSQPSSSNNSAPHKTENTTASTGSEIEPTLDEYTEDEEPDTEYQQPEDTDTDTEQNIEDEITFTTRNYGYIPYEPPFGSIEFDYSY